MIGKAVVFEDKLKVVYREVSIPEPDDEDVVIDVKHSWISIGTESSFLKCERIGGEIPYREGGPWPFPIVAGYQKVGIVTQKGRNVRGLEIGDCVFTSTGKVLDMFNPTGGHIQPSVNHVSQVWKLPSTSSMISYSGMVLTQVGYNCGSRPPVQSGDVAVVIGDGLVGQWTAQTLAYRGAEVIVLGRHDERLSLLPPPIRGINARSENVDSILSESPISIVVDTVGSMETVQAILGFMKRESHWVSAGFLGTKGVVDIQQLRLKEITLHSPSGWTKERMDQTLMGIQEGWLQTESLITHRFPVEDASKAWDLIVNKKEHVLGVILDW